MESSIRSLPSTDNTGEPEAGYRSPRILIVDDSAVNRRFLTGALEEAGYDTLLARNGREAVDACRVSSPDLVLMDVSMPEMDGLEATRRIKDQVGEEFLPVVFITAPENEKALVPCFDAGGDDFMVKPINRVALLARIKALMRTRRLYQTQYAQRRELEYYRDVVEQDQRVAKKIFSTIAHVECLDKAGIRYKLSPISVFNGDLLLGSRIPGGGGYLLIGDFTGHGLSAAIGALPTSEIFYAMAAKGFRIPDIIAEINKRLYSLLPTGMFFAACIIEIETTGDRVRIWNGGIPDVVIRRAETGQVERIPSDHLPLGILANDELSSSTRAIPVANGDRIFVYTDGVIETANSEGTIFGTRRLAALIHEHGSREDVFDRIIQALEIFRAGGDQTDDVTLVEFVCGRHSAQFGADSGSNRPDDGMWTNSLDLEGDGLREFDPRSVFDGLLKFEPTLYERRGQLCTIVAELFNNALEHGVLRLDSALKRDPEGFAEYYAERESRLRNLNGGKISLRLRHDPTENGGRISIEIEDSGPGFDFSNWSAQLATEQKLSGRGIYLTKELCSEVQYHHPGNRVSAVYEWPY